MKKCHERIKDEQHLMMLHMTDNKGITCKAAGEMYGFTKNAVIGVRNRIKQTYWDLDFCQKPENLDCGMTPLWWK